MVPTKVCFVTVGATASFEKLLREVLSERFVSKLKDTGFTHLVVQYGKDGQKLWEEFILNIPNPPVPGPGVDANNMPEEKELLLNGFDFQEDLDDCISLVMEKPADNQVLGLMICHAGKYLYLPLGFKTNVQSIHNLISIMGRNRHDPGGPACRAASHGGPQPRFGQQPPRGAGPEDPGASLRCDGNFGVCELRGSPYLSCLSANTL